MNSFKKHIFTVLTIIQCVVVFGQEKTLADASIYTEFNTFFENEIKRQGVKGNWIFMLNEITGIHKFDYNNDGFSDVLIEFNAIPVEEGSYINYYTVLFKNIENKKYKYINYVETVELKFVQFYVTYFVFQQQKQPLEKIKYTLTNNVFKQVMH